MGIFNLGKLIDGICDINKISLHTSTGPKIIAVDSSIFMYRFLHNSKSYEEYVINIIKFVTKLKKLCIEPIFVLDGKSRQEKMLTLRKRERQKKNLNKRIANLKDKIATINSDSDDSNNSSDDEEKNTNDKTKVELSDELKKLIKKSSYITKKHIELLKTTLTMLGVIYIQSTGEADPFCAALVKAGVADCCLSNDNDIPVYGCPVTYQNFIFQNNQVTEYKLNDILNELQITYPQFVDMCILMGTDYNNPIYGIKPEVAIEAIKTYGDIETILNNLDNINNTIVKYYRKLKYPKLKNLKKPDMTYFDYNNVRNIFMETINIKQCIQHTNYNDMTHDWLYGQNRLSQLEQFLINSGGLNADTARHEIRYINGIWTNVTGRWNSSWNKKYYNPSGHPINKYIQTLS